MLNKLDTRGEVGFNTLIATRGGNRKGKENEKDRRKFPPTNYHSCAS